ncbi:hypothetical protein LTR78_003219 [Recurvomyces mirabilis]|uniref:Uncharacterized protein n=1 Tax=Recurvomyces mirabilis TaxID=574656 RepID=A0AAE1C405_9PEZI|nr:hypothetical protein LTR78_003219 [Recurvomyces mirabilis]KAK5156962.1 hypothetical protein LTS14_004479 [Recurvomyces mirabilis]
MTNEFDLSTTGSEQAEQVAARSTDMTSQELALTNLMASLNLTSGQLANPDLKQAAVTLTEALAAIHLTREPQPLRIDDDCTPAMLGSAAHDLRATRNRFCIQMASEQPLEECLFLEISERLDIGEQGLEGADDEALEGARCAKVSALYSMDEIERMLNTCEVSVVANEKFWELYQTL